MTALALAGYSIGLAGYAAIKVLSPAFYALDDAKVPMMIALASIVVNAVASYFFRNWLSGYGVTPETPSGYGHVGVALATSTVALVNFFALAFFMRRKIGRLNGREIMSGFFRIAIAALVMSAVCYPVYRLLFNALGARGFLNQAVGALVPVAVGGLVFVIAAKLLGIKELDKLFDVLKRKVGRRKLS
jgi:putative peptidoglycan lipid II flippase